MGDAALLVEVAPEPLTIRPHVRTISLRNDVEEHPNRSAGQPLEHHVTRRAIASRPFRYPWIPVGTDQARLQELLNSRTGMFRTPRTQQGVDGLASAVPLKWPSRVG